MGSALLIRGARQLLTLRGPAPRRGRQLSDLGILPDGAVLVVGEHIHSVGSSRRMENLAEARDAEVIDATGKVVMPGFVDSHTHFVFPAPRLADFEQRIQGADHAALKSEERGIYSTVQALRQISPRALELKALRWLRQFAACGTTTVEGKSGYGLNWAAERKSLHVMQKVDARPVEVVRTFLGAHVPPPEHRDSSDEYVDQITREMLPAVRRRRLAEFCDVWCDSGAFSLEQSRKVLEVARSLGLRRKVHADQLARTGGAQLGVEMGATSVDHLEQIETADVEALARSETIATLLPGAVFHVATGQYPPARRMIDRGCAIALATDFNPGTSPTLNMQMVLALACSQMKMSPAEAITAATMNAAVAVRREKSIGSLEPGKFADIIILDVGDYREVTYYFGMNLVHMTIRHGRVIARAGEGEQEQ